MVGEDVLHECLHHDEVESVLVIGRRGCGMNHPKLKERLIASFFNLSTIESQLSGYNACYFCLGVSSIGLNEEEYFKLTHTLTLHFAEAVAKLNPDKEDITIHSIELFETEIASAGTIVLAGVPGKYEEDGHRLGTERVFKAVAGSSAFKIVGGGDSLAVVSTLNLSQSFDWISVGGGAMLEFLAKGTLPGLAALLE